MPAGSLRWPGVQQVGLRQMKFRILLACPTASGSSRSPGNQSARPAPVIVPSQLLTFRANVFRPGISDSAIRFASCIQPRHRTRRTFRLPRIRIRHMSKCDVATASIDQNPGLLTGQTGTAVSIDLAQLAGSSQRRCQSPCGDAILRSNRSMACPTRTLLIAQLTPTQLALFC